MRTIPSTTTVQHLGLLWVYKHQRVNHPWLTNITWFSLYGRELVENTSTDVVLTTAGEHIVAQLLGAQYPPRNGQR